MRPEGAFTCLRKSITEPYSEAVVPGQRPHIILLLRFILILSSHVRLGLPSGHLALGIPIKSCFYSSFVPCLLHVPYASS
jgi:hypothetical protein